jgi:hypothetical protein
MEAASTSETSANFYQTTRRNNSEDSHLHTHRRENLQSRGSGDWSATHVGRFAPDDRATGTHQTGGWVSPQSRSRRGGGEEKNPSLYSVVQPLSQ